MSQYQPAEDTAADIPASVARALSEDIGSGDITAMLIPADKQATAAVICREAAVICGRAWVDEVFRQLDPTTQIEWHIAEGDLVSPEQRLFTLQGNARVLLTGERGAKLFADIVSHCHSG
jgi:nicotinate-nucleotide pyrophosphorylase (carboxylating)